MPPRELSAGALLSTTPTTCAPTVASASRGWLTSRRGARRGGAKQVRHTHIGRHTEELVLGGPAHIRIDEQHPSVQGGDDPGKVRRRARLSLTHARRGDHHTPDRRAGGGAEQV